MVAIHRTHGRLTRAAETLAWLPAQRHAGHNIGDTLTDVIFVELKERPGDQAPAATVGPQGV